MMSSRGRPRKWIRHKDTDFGRFVLKCKLIDRIRGDRIIGSKVLRKQSVPLRDAFWMCDGLSPRDTGRALRMCSDDIATLLIEKQARANPRCGSRLRDFYYTWHKPSKTIVRIIGRRIDGLREQGSTLIAAIETVAAEGLYPHRGSNQVFLPFAVIRSYYRRYQGKRIYRNNFLRDMPLLNPYGGDPRRAMDIHPGRGIRDEAIEYERAVEYG